MANQFNQTDWPNPRRDVRRVQFDPLNLTIRLPIAPPFKQTNWPNPPRVLARQADVVQNATLSLPGSMPFRQMDWGIPGKVSAVVRRDPINLLTTTLGITATPFYQLDWPNPGSRAPVATRRDAVNLLGTTLAPVSVPFAQFDWPNPKLVKQPDMTIGQRSFFIPPEAPAQSYAVRRSPHRRAVR